MSENNKTNGDNLNEENQKTLSNRKRNFKTLATSESGAVASPELASKKMKLTRSNETNAQESSSLESKVYEFEQIITSEPSPSRPGQMRYLIHWKGESIVDATWQHADKFEDPVHIENYEKLSLRAKQTRINKYNAAVQEFKAKAADMTFVDKETQCNYSPDSSNSVEVLSSYCDVDKNHWPKVINAIDKLEIQWHEENIKTFMIISLQFGLMGDKHQNTSCAERVNDMTPIMKKLFEELTSRVKIPIIVVESSSNDDEQVNDKIEDQQDDGLEDTDGEVIYSSSERSQDSSPGTLTQQEITPDSNNPEYDADYEPDEDDVASEVNSEEDDQDHSSTVTQCLSNSNSAPVVSLLTPSDTECSPVLTQNIISEADSQVITLDGSLNDEN